MNAYVGGDAYDYIINANQATAYFVLAVFFALISSTFYLSQNLMKIEYAFLDAVSGIEQEIEEKEYSISKIHHSISSISSREDYLVSDRSERCRDERQT